jgi:hypothetical protein
MRASFSLTFVLIVPFLSRSFFCLVMSCSRSRRFTFQTPIRSVVVYGGHDIKQQMFDLNKGCHILIATPGRLVDFITRARMTLSEVNYLVFDEADRMLDMGMSHVLIRSRQHAFVMMGCWVAEWRSFLKWTFPRFPRTCIGMRE